MDNVAIHSFVACHQHRIFQIQWINAIDVARWYGDRVFYRTKVCMFVHCGERVEISIWWIGQISFKCKGSRAHGHDMSTDFPLSLITSPKVVLHITIGLSGSMRTNPSNTRVLYELSMAYDEWPIFVLDAKYSVFKGDDPLRASTFSVQLVNCILTFPLSIREFKLLLTSLMIKIFQGNG